MAPDAVSQLSSLLSSVEHVISYQPLRTEVSISLFIPENTQVHLIPARASLDPHEIAGAMKDAVGESSCAILIPGRQFDASGTRHGQGGGWYDRFLAEMPKEWLRIGFCFDDQFSEVPLVRQSWDQAMDYVVVVDRKDTSLKLYTDDARD